MGGPQGSNSMDSVLLCSICHAKRSSCRGDHKVAAFGRCQFCGRSDDRISCQMTPEHARRVQIIVYRFTGKIEYPAPRKG